MPYLEIDNAHIKNKTYDVTTSLAEVIKVGGKDKVAMTFIIKNTGANALTDATFYSSINDVEYVELDSTDMQGLSTLQTLASGASCRVTVNTHGCLYVKLYAQAGTATTIKASWNTITKDVPAGQTEIIVPSGGISVDSSATVVGSLPSGLTPGDDQQLIVNTEAELYVGDLSLRTNIGALDDAATEGDTDGTLIAKLRGLALNIGVIADAASVTGTQSAKLRYIGEQINTLISASNALLTTIDADTSAIATDIAAIEVLITATNALLTTIDADTSNISTNSDAIVTDLAAIEVLITATNALLTTIDADTSTLAAWDESGRAATNIISGQVGVTGNTGAIDAGTQRVTMATDDTVATDLTAIKNAVEILDDWDESDRAKVNPIVGQAGVTAGTGIVDVATQRVTVASDDFNLAAINTSTGTVAGWDNAAGDGASVTGDVAHDAVDAGEPVKTGGYATDSQVSQVANGDRVNQVLSRSGEVINSNFDYSTLKDGVTESDPLDEHYLEEELVDTTDISATTHYYPDSSGVSMANYNNISCQFGLVDADGTLTLTVEAKIDDSTDWVDITPAGYELSTNSSGNASYTDTDATGIIDFDNLHVRNVRFRVVASGATNAVQLHIKRVAL